MFKVMAGFILKPGEDSEKFFYYHTKVHAEDVKKAAGPVAKRLIKYSVNRVKKVVEGEMNVYGIVEMWWADEKCMDDYLQQAKQYKTKSGLSPMEDFATHADVLWAIEIDEYEVPLP